MKEKIMFNELVDDIVNRIDPAGHNTDGLKKHYGLKLSILVNLEVEKRIAEILPTDKEGQVASFKRYNLHATDVKHQYKQAAFFLGWRMALDEIRSRLTNPGVNDSQKTEGGGE